MADVRIATASEVAEFVSPESGKKFSTLVPAAVSDGHILAYHVAVEIPAKSSPNGKVLSAPMIKLCAQDVQGMAACNGGKIEPRTPRTDDKDDKRTDFERLIGACDRHNYGLDLDLRAPIRQYLIKSAAGPEAAVKATIKGLIAGGFPVDMVLESPKFRDYPNIKAIVDRVVAEL